MDLEKLNHLDKIMTDQIETGELEGASLYVAKDGEQCYYKNFGYADREKHKLMKNDTIVRLYSMTKPVTSVAAMILLEQGKIDVYDSVSRYLPGFQGQKVYTKDGLIATKRDVVIKDLLSMTAGIVYPDQSHEPGRIMEKLFNEVQASNENGGCVKTVEFCNRMGEVPLLFQPGEAWNYSACADIMGAIIEVVSGMTLGEFMKKEIFDPLDMKDTGFYVPQEKQSRFAELYIYSEEEKKNIICEWRHLALTTCLEQPAFESGGAGLVSTMRDYSHFAQMLANGGCYAGKRILGEKTVEFLSKSQAPMSMVAKAQWDSNHGCGYGNFVRVIEDEAESGCLAEEGEFGWDGWAGTYFFVQPKERLVMIFLIQRCGYNIASLMRKVKNVVYGSIE